MTAEVLVMNTSAIAMAADTAMSIPYGTGTKTYTRARKLLPLHTTEPVAVMVWDAPSHYGLPWEVIVGEFRKEEDKARGKLDDYVGEFFDFVDKGATKWVPAAHETDLLAEVLDPEIRLLQQLWADRLDAIPGTLSDPVLTSAAVEVSRFFATGFRQRYFRESSWAGRTAGELTYLDTNIRSRFNAGASGLWKNLGDAAQNELVELGRERMVYIANDEAASSGLVFAGYGDGELFAQARVWRVNGRLASMTRRVERRRLAISPEHRAFILPLAQEGVIRSFLYGLHPEVDALVGEVVNLVVGSGMPQSGGKNLAQAIKEQFDEQVSMRGDEVARAVEFLPPGDLAVVAGDLIRMTALRNRATMTADTVGGPIDVILLSRADGFRWVEPPDGFRIERDEK
jgi:hypothetical protein